MIEQIITSAAFSAFSRTGTYTPPGEDAEEVEVEVILDLAIEAYDERGSFIADYDTADFLGGVEIERGGVLSSVEGYDGLQWKILSRMEDDGESVTWAVERSNA